ncbi:MAG: nuclear transport factor 2 family protein [Actinomycetota bacterium]|nr:nuclear transport factor 2 family protein [Acidimicrobiia bacterium]MDQ3293948.1 nuclear transport factor 2 family protein [Actinomycetota bacterium]
MSFDLGEVSDRLEIHDVLARYSYAIDFRRWADLDAIFTPDATIDYRATGGITGNLAEIEAFLDSSFAMVNRSQHLMATTVIDFEPDRAAAATRTMCHNPMVFAGAGGIADPGRLAVFGLWYHDRFVRTAAGWRIAQRTQEQAYAFLPDGTPFQVPQ